MPKLPDGLGAVMFREEGSQRRAWIVDDMPILPAVGDFIESAVDVLGPDEPKNFGKQKRAMLVGRIIERRFINRNGSWACVLSVGSYSIRLDEAAGQQQPGEPARQGEPSSA